MNKFIEPTDMNGEAFFSRWKNLSMPSQVDAQSQQTWYRNLLYLHNLIQKPNLSTYVQESQKIFKAEYPMENVEATKTKLIGYGFQLLEGEHHIFGEPLFTNVQESTRIRTTLFARASFTREQSRLECYWGSNPINKLRSGFPLFQPGIF